MYTNIRSSKEAQKVKQFKKNKSQKKYNALLQRKKTLAVMFKLETKKALDLFDEDKSGDTDFEEFETIIKRVLVKEELPEDFQGSLQEAIRQLDTDGDGSLDLDEVNVWFKKLFHHKVQSRGFRRVRELKKMKDIFEMCQDSMNIESYILASNRHQLYNFVASFFLEAELYNSPIYELTDTASLRGDVKDDDRNQVIEEVTKNLIEFEKSGKIYFDDISEWYIKSNGGWKLLSKDGI